MKPAVSVPNGVHEQAEGLESRIGRTRIEIDRTAAGDDLAHHEAGPVTAAMDEALDEIEPKPDPFMDAAARETLAGAEW